ncbi:MAG: HlyD family efflux transporter periplasmic adaptor subunit [Wenzhouxiangella sp.]|nr:HlyD family efflux transporter periplasmic adaptor subunit [Wenzhouxiangella sp.]
MDIARPELKRHRRLRQIVMIGAATLLLLALAWLALRAEPAAPRVDRAAGGLETVEVGERVRQVRGPGSLVPRETRWVPAASAGRVERILIRPGARVTPETVLIELSNPELVQEVDERRFDIEAMEANLASLRADLERQLLDAHMALASARADHASHRLEAEAEAELAERGIVSQIQYQRSALRVSQMAERVEMEKERIVRIEASIRSQLNAESARLAQARQRLARLEQRLADLHVRAGVAGVLQRIDVEEGQQLLAGANIGRIVDPDDLIAQLRISESQAREIALDQPATIDTRGSLIGGRVVRIDPTVTDGTVQVDIELTDTLPVGARPDLSVDGLVELERLSDVLHVGRPAYGQPESAISLFRLNDNGHAERVPVRLGRASVNRVEVVSGLAAGDRVILSDLSSHAGHDRLRLN